MKIALCQINATIGDFAGNKAKILSAYNQGVAAGVDLVVLPELAVTGYPPRDLLLRPNFVETNLHVVNELAVQTGAVGLLVGLITRNDSRPGRELSNAAALLQNGRIVGIRTKTLLPTYDVFDEDRYFEPAKENRPVEFNNRLLGITICEDIWNDEDFWRERRYPVNPAALLVQAGADIIINISASPWHLGKTRLRYQMLSGLAQKYSRPVVYCNLVGGNDELIFDGESMAFNRTGQLIAQGKKFNEDFIVVDTENAEAIVPRAGSNEERVFQALVLGVRDYCKKCGFKTAILGLSGGIDSALTACIAAAAIGPENVTGFSLPSAYSSASSLEDARLLAKNLGINYKVIPINDCFEVAKASLKEVFAGCSQDVTEENMQARIRGLLLMAISNKFGSLLLTTGNKSELATGYCTLYGDMCGGLAVISDVPKTMVYKLARWINRAGEIIPESTISKAPSAELRPGQTDQDTLPPYEVLDSILDQYIVQLKSPEEIIANGFDRETVFKVIGMISRSEFKRRQAAPGIKITSTAFGIGRRIPIAQKFVDF